jgi:hypothetical protein
MGTSNKDTWHYAQVFDLTNLSRSEVKVRLGPLAGHVL